MKELNAGDVIRAGLRALSREEVGASLKQFEEVMARLPPDPLTPDVAQDVEARIRARRAAEARKAGK